MHFPAWSKVFLQPCSKTFKSNFWALIPIQRQKNMHWYDTDLEKVNNHLSLSLQKNLCFDDKYSLNLSA